MHDMKDLHDMHDKIIIMHINLRFVIFHQRRGAARNRGAEYAEKNRNDPCLVPPIPMIRNL